MAKYTPFGLAVKIEMLKKDIETADMAKQIGTSPQYFLDILKGARPGKEIKPKIAELLGINETEGA